MTPLLAQVAPPAIEVTAGPIAASVLLMGALAGGIGMIGIWLTRRSSGQHVLPEARRRPLYIPPALMIVGLIWVSLMAVTALAVADRAPVVAPPAVENQSTGDEEITTGDPATPTSAADSSQDADDPQSAESVNTPGNPQEQSTDSLRAIVVRTMTFQLWILTAFGLVVLIVQRGHHRSIGDDSQYALAPASLANTAEQPTSVPRTNQWPDLDAHPMSPHQSAAGSFVDNPAHQTDFPTVPRGSAIGGGNPYAAPDTEPAENVWSSNAAAPAVVCEAWRFPTEVRWAFEVFLVALLPTFLLRLLLVRILQDPSQHPFLEMLNSEADWKIIALITLMAIVIAPLCEELLYRVIVLGGFMQTRTVMTGWIASSLLFAFAHGFPDSIALVPLALAIGYAYVRRRSYRTVVLIHFLFNGFNMLLAGLALV